MNKSLLLFAALVAASSAMYDSWDAIPVSENKEAAPAVSFADESVSSLAQEAAHLRDVSQAHMALHVDRISRHAVLLQGASAEDKAKAYAHNFDRSKNAIRSALKALTAQLNAGHRHDSAALRGEKGRGNKIISTAQNKGRAKCAEYRAKACPTQRLEREAHAKKEAARRSMNNQGNGKVCSGGLGTTFGDMDVEKNVPKFGTELRNKWNRARANYLKYRGKFNAAAKAHRAAEKKRNAAMAKFRTALKIEVANADSACKNAHKEYEALKREVASNVNSRKQVFISTLLITCYVDNITSMGPANWKPSVRSCHARHWNEKSHKEKANKKERSGKEKSKKAAAREKSNKAAARERSSKAAAKEKKSKSAGAGNGGCNGKGWCETFYKCDSGDKRHQFVAWNRNAGYRRMKGACAVKGKYGNRHKFWGGKFSVSQCKAKCDAMAGKCHGITMKQSEVKCPGHEITDDETDLFQDGSMPMTTMSSDVAAANMNIF